MLDLAKRLIFISSPWAGWCSAFYNSCKWVNHHGDRYKYHWQTFQESSLVTFREFVEMIDALSRYLSGFYLLGTLRRNPVDSECSWHILQASSNPQILWCRIWFVDVFLLQQSYKDIVWVWLHIFLRSLVIWHEDQQGRRSWTIKQGWWWKFLIQVGGSQETMGEGSCWGWDASVRRLRWERGKICRWKWLNRTVMNMKQIQDKEEYDLHRLMQGLICALAAVETFKNHIFQL